MNIKNIILNAIAEDFGNKIDFKKDKTTYKLCKDIECKAVILAKEQGIFSGEIILDEMQKIFKKKIKITKFILDKQEFKKNQAIAEIRGNSLYILGIERTILNFLSRLSGIAALTNKFVRKAGNIKIYDTRKTTPGLRILEKYAVQCGGGYNHRMNLSDIMVKDNHKMLNDGVENVIKKLRKLTNKKIIVEVDNIKEFNAIIKENVDIIMFDNMKIADIKNCIKQKRKNIEFEITGGVNLRNISKYKIKGIDRISIGALTHSFKIIDFSMEIVKDEN